MKNQQETFGNVFSKKNEKVILKSIFPGGKNWKIFSEKNECKNNCPTSNCNGDGPHKICTKKWEQAPLNIKTLETANHIFTYFEYYNRGDLNVELPSIYNTIGKLREKCAQLLLEFEFENTGTDSLVEKKIRDNQHVFRKNLLKYWNGCAVTNVKNERLLVASHIKPWCKCDPNEKLHKYNGLLLIPQLDFLFDNGFISFSNSGKIIISKKMDGNYASFAINNSMRLYKIEDQHKVYLKFHRDYWGLNK